MPNTQWSLARLKRARAAVAAWATANRHRTVVVGGSVLVLIALVLGIAFGIEVATLAIVVYGTVFAGVTMLGITPLRALPALDVGLWVDGELVSSFTPRSDRPRTPIDIDACVRNALATINAETPAPPPSAFTAALGLSDYEALGGIGSLESRKKAVERLQSEMQEYATKLRQWLEAFESRRRPSYHLICRDIAIHNSGESAADEIILRLHMPKGIVPMIAERLEALNIKPPPEPPKYERRSMLGFSGDVLSSIGRPLMPDLSGLIPSARAGLVPVWTREQRRDVAEVRMPTLTHGVTELTTAPLQILPREPGTYEITWDAHVGNLRRPARGTIRLVVEPMPEGGEPLTNVAQVVQSGDVEVENEIDYQP